MSPPPWLLHWQHPSPPLFTLPYVPTPHFVSRWKHYKLVLTTLQKECQQTWLQYPSLKISLSIIKQSKLWHYFTTSTRICKENFISNSTILSKNFDKNCWFKLFINSFICKIMIGYHIKLNGNTALIRYM